MAEAIGATDPATLQMLGEIWSYAELTRSAIRAAEEGAYHHGNGALVPGWQADGRAASLAAVLVPAGERDHPADRVT